MSNKYIAYKNRKIKKLLFIDFECSNSYNGEGKICSFGYVLTDLNLNVIKKEDVLVNPEAPFDTNPRSITLEQLGYKESDYLKEGNFKQKYPFLRSLLADENTLVFGFSFSNDIKFLEIALKRYNLEVFEFYFIDIQSLYLMFDSSISNFQMPSLDSINLYLETGYRQEYHIACEDSFLTLKILSKILEKTSITLEKIVLDSNLVKSFINEHENNIVEEKNKIEFLTEQILKNKEDIIEEMLSVFSKNIFKKLFPDNAETMEKSQYILPYDFIMKNLKHTVSLIYELAKCKWIFVTNQYYTSKTNYINNHNNKMAATKMVDDFNEVIMASPFHKASKIKDVKINPRKINSNIDFFKNIDADIYNLLVIFSNYLFGYQVYNYAAHYKRKLLKHFNYQSSFAKVNYKFFNTQVKKVFSIKESKTNLTNNQSDNN